jgi:chemotaxis protein MotB
MVISEKIINEMNIHELLQAELEDSGDDNGKNRWLITYADVITLLLGFFILMLAISDINPVKVEEVNKSTSKNFGTTGVDKQVEILSIQELIDEVNRIIKKEKLENQVEVKATNRGVVVSGKGSTFFHSGEAEVLPQAHMLLTKLGNQINKEPYDVAIEGHTDNVPIRSSNFPSNWELSSARASNIVRYLISTGVKSTKLRAVGFADTVPKFPNDSETNRAKNRRIEIVFLISSGKQ